MIARPSGSKIGEGISGALGSLFGCHAGDVVDICVNIQKKGGSNAPPLLRFNCIHPAELARGWLCSLEASATSAESASSSAESATTSTAATEAATAGTAALLASCTADEVKGKDFSDTIEEG